MAVTSPRARWGLLRIPVSARVVLLSVTITGLQGIIALATAKWLGATERGVLSIAQTLNALAMLLVSAGFLQGTRVLLADPNGTMTVRRYVTATRVQTALYGVVAAVLSVTALRWLGGVTAPAVVIIWIIWSVALFRFSHLREVEHGLGHHVAALRTEVLAGVIGLVAIGTWWLFRRPLTVEVAMAALGAGYIVAWMLLGRRVGKDQDASERLTPGVAARVRDLSTIFAFCYPGLIAAMGLVVASRMDQLLLAGFKGPKAVGVYSMASTLSDLAWALPLGVVTVTTRRARHSEPHLLPAMHRTTWRRVVGSTVLLSSAILAASWFLLEKFLGGDFRGSTHIVAILFIGSVALASQQVDQAICAGLGDLSITAIAAGWGIGVGLIAYVVLIPRLGVAGCAWANDITFVTMAAAARVVMLRRLRQAGVR